MHPGPAATQDDCQTKVVLQTEPNNNSKEEEDLDYATSILNLAPSLDVDESMEHSGGWSNTSRSSAKLTLLDGVYFLLT